MRTPRMIPEAGSASRFSKVRAQLEIRRRDRKGARGARVAREFTRAGAPASSRLDAGAPAREFSEPLPLRPCGSLGPRIALAAQGDEGGPEPRSAATVPGEGAVGGEGTVLGPLLSAARSASSAVSSKRMTRAVMLSSPPFSFALLR